MELSDFHESFYVKKSQIRFKRKVVDSLWQNDEFNHASLT